MSNKYTITKLSIKSTATKWLYCAVAVLVVLTTVIAALPARAEAYAQVTGRSVQMSSTASGATNVAYQVNFTTVTNNQTIGSIVFEICANSPIIGDTCTAPAAPFNTNFATLTVNNVTANVAPLTVDTVDSTANRVVLNRTAGAVANGAVSFTLGNGTTNGITNPNTTGTFYARILVVPNTTGTMPGTPANENNATDAGGIAINVASQLTVTAKVQEALSFCVYTGATCAAGGTSVTLGDANGVLASTTTVYTSTAKYDVSSNAISGVNIRIKGDTLKSGSASITPYGAACAADSTSSSVSQFGLRMSALGAGQTAGVPYNCTAGNHGFDNNTTNGTLSQFGQTMASTSAPSDISTSTMELAAKSANTSQAGVYTTTLTLIATATY